MEEFYMSGDGELKIEIDGTLQQKYDMITKI